MQVTRIVQAMNDAAPATLRSLVLGSTSSRPRAAYCCIDCGTTDDVGFDVDGQWRCEDCADERVVEKACNVRGWWGR